MAALAQLAEAQAVCDFLTGLCAKELEALSDSHATSPAWASAGIAAVVRLCHDPASAANAAATLANLSWADDANGDRIREAGAILQLVALLSGGPESDARTKAALVLGYLASNVSLGLEHIVTITEAGAIPPLVALLTGGPESDAATNAALALGYLASSGANTVAITEAGAIPLLVALLSGGPDSEAADNAAGALRNLTLNDNATSTAITNAGATGVTAGDVDGDVNAWGFMANAKYTFNRTGEVRPFVLAGLGMAKVSADNINVAGVSLTDDSDTVVAYQAGVGVSYQFSPTMSVDASYRLFQTADPTLNDSAGSPFDTSYTSHSFLVGMTFGF